MEYTAKAVKATIRHIEQRLESTRLTSDDLMGLFITSAAMFGLLISEQPMDTQVIHVRCNSARRNIKEARFFGITFTISRELLQIINVTESLVNCSSHRSAAISAWRETLRRLLKMSNYLQFSETTNAAAPKKYS